MKEISPKKGRLRWKKEAPETGLRAVGARPRAHHLHDGVDEYATVYPNGGGWQRPQAGWYWVAFGAVPRKNTCDTPVADLQQAKDEAAAYVKEHLGKATGEQ